MGITFPIILAAKLLGSVVTVADALQSSTLRPVARRLPPSTSRWIWLFRRELHER
jgi:hypothetical protein